MRRWKQDFAEVLGTSHELLDAMDRPIVGVDKLVESPHVLPPLRTWQSAGTESLPNNITVPIR